MKKTILSFFGAVLLSLLIWGCDDNRMDLDIKWIFEPEVQLSETAQVDISTDLKLKINSTVYKQGYNEHYFQFVGNKNSVLISPTGDTIRMNKDIKIPFDGEFQSYKFLGKEEGVHDVKFLFRNSKDYKAEVTKKINMKIAEFSFDATSGSIGAINVPKPVTLILTPPATSPKGTVYKFKYKKGDLSGTLKDGNGKILEEGVLYPITSGNNPLSFIPTTATDKGLISFIAVDNYGKEKEAKVTFKINQNSFDFEAKTTGPSALVNANLPLSFKITPADASTASGSYKMKFTSNFEGTLAGYKTGEEFEVSSGTFELNYKGLAVGEHTVNISVKDTFGTVINKELKIQINPQTFSFTAVTDNLNPIISSPTNLNFNITPATSNQVFKMKYQILEGKGLFYNNGEEVSPNNLFVVDKGEFSKTFKPTTGGAVKLRITVINQDGYEVNQEINYAVNVPEFTFTASALSASQTQNTVNKINYILSPIGSTPQDFQIKFEDTGDAKINGYEKNTWFEINSGTGSLNYVPSSSGQHSVKLIVKSKQYNTEQTQTITIEVGLHDFTFAAINQHSQWVLETAKSLSFNIDPIGTDTGISYSMAYKVTQGQGVLEGFSPSVYQAVGKGSFNVNFTPKSQGAISIEFSVKNSDGTIKTQTLALNIESVDFAFTTTSQSSTTTVGTPINVAYTLEPSAGVNQSFELRFETSGDGQLNGYNEGVWFPVDKGSGTLKFTPTSAGQHQVTVTARSSFGINKTSQFTVNTGLQAFDFVVSPSSSAGVINTNLPINFTLSPVGNDNGQTYQMRYIVENGSGSIEGMTAGTWFVVDKGSFAKNYLPTTPGAHKITFYAKNTAGTEITKTVDLNINQPDFNFSGVPVKTSSVINEEIDVNFNLESIGDDLGSTYQMSYTSTGLSTLDGQQQNILFPVTKGNFTLKYKALAVGNHAVTVKVKNKFGVEKTATFSINVSNYDFSFTAVANNINPIINSATPVSMNITPIGIDPNVSYEVKFEMLSGSGKLENFNPGVYIPVSKGNFNMNFTPSSAGQVSVKITAKNSAGATHEQIVNFNVSVPDFNFSTTSQSSTTTVGNHINVAYNLEPVGGTTQTYEVKFETSGDGQLNGYNEGVWFAVSSNSGTFEFKPTNQGQHQVTITARSNFGITKTTSFNVNVDIQKFDFVASPSSSAGVINTNLPINFTLSPVGNDNGQTYQMRYIVENGSGSIEGMTAGTWFVVDKGSFAKNYLPTTPGAHKITFYAKNTAGTEITKTFDLNINQPDFNFSGVPVKTSSVINEEIDVNFNLESIGDDLGSTYQMSYTSTGLSTLDGQQQNILFPVTKGNFTLKYKALAVGNHAVTVKVKNKFGVEKTATFSINVSNYDFSFTAVANNINPIINTATPVSMNITPIGIDPNVDYFIKYEILAGQGVLENFNPGVYQPIGKGNFEMNFKPITTGDVTIRLTAKNSAGSVHEQIVKFAVSVPDFNFSTTSQANSTTVGTPINVAYNLEPIGSNSQTYEVKFETSGDGQLGYNSNFNNEGVWFSVSSGSGSFQFKPTSSGQHQVTITVRSNFGVIKTTSFVTNVITPRFNFTATPSALQFVLNQEVPVNMNITPIDSDAGLTYDLKYEITSGSGVIAGMTPGVFKEVNKGDFKINFTSSQAGSTAIKFTARNSAGTEVTQTVSLNTISAQFNVTAANLKNSVYLNTPVVINYSIDNLGLTQNYEVMMTTDGTGTIDGKQEGVWYSISNLTGQLEFTPTSLGNHQIILNFRNQFGVIKNVNLNLTSVSQDYTFTATSNQNDLIINQLKTLDFNITPVTQSAGIDYFVKYEILQGSATVNGMQPNTYISANTGNWSNGITPTAGGQLTIKFTAKNSNGLLKEQTLNFNVQTPNFALNGSYQPKTTFWRGENIDINYMINQYISQSQTFEYTIESNLPGSFDGGKTLGTWQPLGATSGNLQFMPNGKGIYSITVKVRNQYGDEKQFSFSINVVSAPIIESSSQAVYQCTPAGWAGVSCTGYVRVVANNGGNIKITKVKIYNNSPYPIGEATFNKSFVDFIIQNVSVQSFSNINSNVKIEVTNEFGDVSVLEIPWIKQ